MSNVSDIQQNCDNGRTHAGTAKAEVDLHVRDESAKQAIKGAIDHCIGDFDNIAPAQE